MKSPSPIVAPSRCSTSTASSPLSSLPPPHTHRLWMWCSHRMSQLRQPGIEFFGHVLVLPSTKTRTSSLCGLGLRRGWVHHPRLPVSGRLLPVLGTGAGPPGPESPPTPHLAGAGDVLFPHLLLNIGTQRRETLWPSPC